MMLSALRPQAQSVPKRPPLIVNVVVEGLDDNYINLLAPSFSHGGFKRLMASGAALSHLDYGTDLDPVAATAMLMTGAAPMANGIPRAYIYDPAVNQVSPIFSDPAYMGNFTDETLSPASMKVSTLSDEIRIDTDGDGLVYAVAADPQMAIALAGHSANGAYWLNDRTANWATTSYYGDMPRSVIDCNYRSPLLLRIDTIRWEPALRMDAYPLLSRSESAKPFKVTFPKKSADRIYRFKASPKANTELTDLAIELIRSSKMGSDIYPDMISVAYTVAPLGASRAEVMDAYIRLDRDLARLYSEADHAAGAGNVAFILCGVPATDTGSAADDPRHRIPSGEYSIRKATSLLNMYLIAVHGNGDWISGYFDKQFYLNRKLITDRGLSLADFRAEVADFLVRMAGVCNVYTVDDILASRVGDDPGAIKRNTSIAHTGDVIIEINPGWTIVDEPVGTRATRGVERHNATRIPAYILAPGLTPVKIDTPTDARAIAPEVSRLLHVRAPNAASAPALRLR